MKHSSLIQKHTRATIILSDVKMELLKTIISFNSSYFESLIFNYLPLSSSAFASSQNFSGKISFFNFLRTDVEFSYCSFFFMLKI